MLEINTMCRPHHSWHIHTYLSNNPLRSAIADFENIVDILLIGWERKMIKHILWMNIVNKIIHQHSVFFWTQLLTHPLNQHLLNFVQGMLEVFQLYVYLTQLMNLSSFTSFNVSIKWMIIIPLYKAKSCECYTFGNRNLSVSSIPLA